MDWISQCINKIIQSQIWRFVSTHFYWVDWITLFFLFWGILSGIRQGFLRTLVKAAEALLIAYLTFLYHEKVSLQMHTYLPFLSVKVLPAAGFIGIALPAALLILFLDSQMNRWFQTTLPAPVRSIGGAVTGFFYGIFLWSFLSQALLATPVKGVQKSYEKGISISGPFIKTFAPQLYQKIKR